MNNIYRRQPIVHKLPSDYASIDNVKYFNINNVVGLQVYDNPLAAEQNSTYNCKNTYRDELGNLTVRPAVRYDPSDISTTHMTSDVRYFKETSLGLVVVREYGGATFPNDFDTLNFIYKDQTQGGAWSTWQRHFVHNTEISVEETSDGVYFLFQYAGGDKRLEFWKAYVDKEDAGKIKVVEVTGEIQLNDNLNPKINLYNILNDKIYSNQTVINGDDTKNTYVKLASIISGIDNTAAYILKILKYAEGTAVFYYEINNFKAILFRESGSISKIDFGEYRRDTYAANNDKCLIKDYFDGKYFDITLAHLAKDNNQTYITRFVLNYDNSFSRIDSFQATNKSHSGKYFVEAYPLFDGYYVGCDTEPLTDNKYEIKFYICKAGSIVQLLITNKKYYNDYTYGENCYNIFAFGKYVILGRITESYTSYSSYTVEFEAFDVTNRSSKGTGSLGPAQLKYRVAEFNWLGFDNCCIIQPIRYDSATGYFSGTKWTLEPRLSRFVGTSVINGIFRIVQLSNNAINTYDFSSNSTNNLYIYDNSRNLQSIVYTINNIDSDNDAVTEYYLPDMNAGFVFGDWVLQVLHSPHGYDIEYYKRAIEGTDILLTRPTDRIPVLSQFSEGIITSFYLDGFYWFVTEKHVFGTGAANGVITIEFFDPKKYFAFTETITAAMRISDTSFWVFHNEGAYLIYKSTITTEDGTEYAWLCTNTAKSKGCDFRNAIVTLPVTSAVAVVTSEDICSVEMKENIQSDDRTLVPMTLSFRQLIRDLLNETESIKICTYHYLTIFFLNKVKPGLFTPAVVYDSTIDSWWYWEFPFVHVYQCEQTETNVKILAEAAVPSANRFRYYFSEDLFTHSVGSIDYEIYSDKLYDWTPKKSVISQISWQWESAILIFNTVDFRKQLLFTTYVFDDYNIPDNDIADKTLVNFEFYFNIYSRKYANTSPQVTSTSVERVTNNACRTMIANFNYLQLILRNRKFESDSEEYQALTKPKICSISLKYRILRGTLT